MTLDKSRAAFAAAADLIPGGVNSPVRAFKSVGGTPPFIAKGQGAYIEDIDGNRYVDFVQSWGPLVLGHADAVVESAVIEAVKKGLSFGAPTLAESELASEVLGIYDFLDQIRFVSSGTEAVMSAIRLARAAAGKNGIVKFKGCYHGHSDALLVQAGSGAATFGSPSSPGVPSDVTKHTHLAEYNDIEGVRRCFESGDIACVIIEPIAGNMGLVPATQEFLRELRSLCDAHGALLIFDEVMSGFRASLKGACGLTEVRPDIVALGKVIGGGMPVGAFAAKKQIMSLLSPVGSVYQAGTLSGNPVAMAAGLAMIRQLKAQPQLYARLESLAKRLMAGFKAAADSCGIPLQTDVRGSMFGFFFIDKHVASFADALGSDTKRFGAFHGAMLSRGVYLAASQFEAGFICSVMDEALIDEVIQKAHEAMREIA